LFVGALSLDMKTERERDRARERKGEREKERKEEKERDRKTHTRAHVQTRISASVRSIARIFISRCPLELGEVNGHAFIFIGPGCLEILILQLFLPPARPATHPHRSRHCSHAPHPSFPTSSPLYPFFPFSFSVVMSLTFRQSLHWLLGAVAKIVEKSSSRQQKMKMGKKRRKGTR